MSAHAAEVTVAATALRVEHGAKRVRAVLGGEVVADTTNVRLVWEKPHYPTYYFPAADVRADALADTGETRERPAGTAHQFDVHAGGRTAPGAAQRFDDSPVALLAGTVRLSWQAMDAWFEEDEEVYVHPRDPYTRVDVLQSSRHVRVEVDGVTVADSHQPRMLFETGLPPRFYLPKTDVRMDLLSPTDTATRCPYKGTASYYAVRGGAGRRDDLAWWYQHPTLEASKVAGYVCFYDEQVDTYVDGELRPRPETPFS